MQEIISLINLELIVSAVVTTFVVSAFNTVQNKISSNWLVFIVSIVVTILRVSFISGDFAAIQELLFKILLTMSFAILFYNYIGRWFIDTLFARLKDKFTK